MPDTEQHVALSPAVRDIIIGMSDGLTVPFAIAAGLASAAASDATIIIAAVLSEIAAGSISMGLGGYLAANTEARHYNNELSREEREVVEKPDVERREVEDVFIPFGISREQMKPVVDAIVSDKQRWINFMMRFELGLEAPDKARELKSAATIGGAYIVGGFIPLSPYLFLHNDVPLAFELSIFITLVALVFLGYLRGWVIGERPWMSVVQTVIVGVIAGAAAYTLAKFVP